jgi:hypothetical protein
MSSPELLPRVSWWRHLRLLIAFVWGAIITASADNLIDTYLYYKMWKEVWDALEAR